MAHGHGGARSGAGAPQGPREPKSQASHDIDYWKARHEEAKALAAERENDVAEGKLLDRAHVAAASATAMSTFVQHSRALPDALERTLGLPPPVIEAISISLDAALSALADDLKALSEMPQ